ncbi:hypothetical protein [Shewanella algae]|uniref:hypothetical protein n=1 Tax=Shewanella algae TaxID=38313 RepID=UPI0031F5C842
MEKYREAVKDTARKSVLEKSIIALTKDRSTSTLASRDYVRRVKENLTSRDCDRKYHASQLRDETISRWEGFYDSIVSSKKASDLKVAYLSGPNPENDLTEMTNLGILPENIWAFESDTTTYNEAVISALSSDFPFIKLIKSNIGTFFSVSPQKFDIIYLDFCGPLPSRNKKQRTLKAITSILSHHSLNSPGVLVTNVSLPSKEQDSKGYDLIAKLVASYLYPKSFIESSSSPTKMTDGPITSGYYPDTWDKEVKDNLEYYYGQYVTRLLLDIITIISPYNTFNRSNSVFRNLFEVSDKEIEYMMSHYYHFNEKCDGGNIISDTMLYPVLWTFSSLNKSLNQKDENYSQNIYADSEYEKFCNSFLSQLSNNDDINSLLKNVSSLHFLLGEDNDEKYHSKSLNQISSISWFNRIYPFCDMFLFHQIKELLFRQIAVPYHPNITATERWQYKAKETNMYMDMIVLDECRYIYDWMPSVDMIENSLDDIQRQLSFRFALDAISKHRRYTNPEIFFGTASVGDGSAGFEAKWLKPRLELE